MAEFEIDISIRRCAAIEDELKSLGATKLLKEQKELKDSIKRWLIGHKEDTVDHGQSIAFYDEVSNWQATVSERTRDEWDLGKLSNELTNKQRKRYITLQADKDAIKEGIDNGDLSRANLEKVAAVSRQPYSYALYIRERKQDAPI